METRQLEQLWKDYSRIPATHSEGSPAKTYYIIGYQCLLFLIYPELTSADWDQLNKWDFQEIDTISDAMKQRYEETVKVEKSIRELVKEEYPFYVESRIRFLKEKIAFYKEYTNNFYKQYELNRRKGLTFHQREMLTFFWKKDDVEAALKRLEKELYRLEHQQEIKDGQITEQMISLAKEYPFSTLLEFNQAGFARCPYHKEQTASFSLHKKLNYAHCFGCGKSVDTIQYVIDIQEKTFVQAVRFLNQ